MKNLQQVSKVEVEPQDDACSLYDEIKDLSPNWFTDFQDLLKWLCPEGNSLILTRPRQNDDVVWTEEEELEDMRDFVWPFPVDRDQLRVPPFKRHFRMTRYEVVVWSQAAVAVPGEGMPALIKMLKESKGVVRAIVEADEGVVVVFNVDATDFLTWTRECRRLKKMLAVNNIESGKFLLHNLVPITSNPNGAGTLLFLA